jgi:hypothetical protein
MNFPFVTVWISNDSEGDVLLSDLKVIFYITLEGQGLGVDLRSGLNQPSSFLDEDNNAAILLTNSLAEALQVGAESASILFGYHANDWTDQNTTNDYSHQPCDGTANENIVLCRRIAGQWDAVWGTPPAYDSLGCTRP